jgi:hypothetical protein
VSMCEHKAGSYKRSGLDQQINSPLNESGLSVPDIERLATWRYWRNSRDHRGSALLRPDGSWRMPL